MKVYYDSDANAGALRERRVAVIGYGSQGFAQSNNMKDSGVDVTVGLKADSPSRAKAEAAGLKVLPVARAAAEADIVMMLVPDEVAADVYAREVAESMTPGKYLSFSHGFSIHYGFIKPPEDVNVFMVAPKGPGHLVRSEYVRGAGVPCEQAVLCGGLTALIKAGFETLTEAGYAPEMAYFECLHEMKLIVDLLYEGGISEMRYSISNTAQYGDMTRGPIVVNDETKRRMRALLAEIQSGAFAREWMRENRNGKERFRRLERQTEAHPIEQVGRNLREMMPWLSGGRLVDRAKN